MVAKLKVKYLITKLITRISYYYTKRYTEGNIEQGFALHYSIFSKFAYILVYFEYHDICSTAYIICCSYTATCMGMSALCGPQTNVYISGKARVRGITNMF